MIHHTTRALAIVALTAFALVASSGQAHAKGIRSAGTLGVGLGGGTATSGLSAKYHLSGSNAIQATLGSVAFGNDNGKAFGVLAVSADYLFEMPKLAGGSVLDVAWNAGIGVGTHLGDWTWVGVSGVLGLELLFKPVPIDIVLEWRPTVGIVPDVGFGFAGTTGHIRWNF